LAEAKYSIDDPVDVIRYWIDNNWDKAVVQPKPTVASMFNKQTVRLPTEYNSAVRPYCPSMTPQREDWYGEFYFYNWNITVDVRAGNEPTAKMAANHVVSILETQRPSLNPNDEGVYTWLVVKKIGNLSDTRNKVFHKVVEIDFHSRFQDAQLHNLGFRDIPLKVSITA
jgi:hypothetical protein